MEASAGLVFPMRSSIGDLLFGIQQPVALRLHTIWKGLLPRMSKTSRRVPVRDLIVTQTYS